jgi:hypothetical protein
MEKEVDIQDTYDSIVSSVGATLVIAVILFSSWITKFLPNPVLTAIGIFFSIPLFFNFIFGIFFNNPNYSIRRKYGFGAYLLILMGVFFFFNIPTSLTNAFMLFLQLILGFLISIISGIIYISTYKLFSKYSYRVKAIVSFVVSFILTYAIIFALKYFGVISWLK